MEATFLILFSMVAKTVSQIESSKQQQLISSLSHVTFKCF
jgi:hypothetical protein